MGTRIGDSKLEFGTTDETYGLVQTESLEDSVEEAEAKGGQNDVKGVEQTNRKKRVTGTYLYRNNDLGNAPSAHVGSGIPITLLTSGATVYINRVTDEWSNGDFRSVSFEGTEWTQLGS